MELGELPYGTGMSREAAHRRCLEKAMQRLHHLLTHDTALQDHSQIHAAKTTLYVAIEQMGIQAERLCTLQRMLRELLSIVNCQYQSPGHDKQVGLQILKELQRRSQSLG